MHACTHARARLARAPVTLCRRASQIRYLCRRRHLTSGAPAPPLCLRTCVCARASEAAGAAGVSSGRELARGAHVWSRVSKGTIQNQLFRCGSCLARAVWAGLRARSVRYMRPRRVRVYYLVPGRPSPPRQHVGGPSGGAGTLMTSSDTGLGSGPRHARGSSRHARGNSRQLEATRGNSRQLEASINVP